MNENGSISSSDASYNQTHLTADAIDGDSNLEVNRQPHIVSGIRQEAIVPSISVVDTPTSSSHAPISSEDLSSSKSESYPQQQLVEKVAEECTDRPTIKFFANKSQNSLLAKDAKMFEDFKVKWKSTADIQISEKPFHVHARQVGAVNSTRLLSFCGIPGPSVTVPVLRRICIGVGIPIYAAETKAGVLNNLVEWKETLEKEFNGPIPIILAGKEEEIPRQKRGRRAAPAAVTSSKKYRSQQQTSTTKAKNERQTKRREWEEEEGEDDYTDSSDDGFESEDDDFEAEDDDFEGEEEEEDSKSDFSDDDFEYEKDKDELEDKYKFNNEERPSQKQVIKDMIDILDQAINELEEKKNLLLNEL